VLASGTLILTSLCADTLLTFFASLFVQLILSRSLKTYAMCPLIDFINHSSQEQVGLQQGPSVQFEATQQSHP
jgi:hypothetical protein